MAGGGCPRSARGALVRPIAPTRFGVLHHAYGAAPCAGAGCRTAGGHRARADRRSPACAVRGWRSARLFGVRDADRLVLAYADAASCGVPQPPCIHLAAGELSLRGHAGLAAGALRNWPAGWQSAGCRCRGGRDAWQFRPYDHARRSAGADNGASLRAWALRRRLWSGPDHGSAAWWHHDGDRWRARLSGRCAVLRGAPAWLRNCRRRVTPRVVVAGALISTPLP